LGSIEDTEIKYQQQAIENKNLGASRFLEMRVVEEWLERSEERVGRMLHARLRIAD
jgi:hypothetical protein